MKYTDLFKVTANTRKEMDKRWEESNDDSEKGHWFYSMIPCIEKRVERRDGEWL